MQQQTGAARLAWLGPRRAAAHPHPRPCTPPTHPPTPNKPPLCAAGVSESIIMGIPMPTGTGLFKVMQRAEVAPQALKPRPPPLLAF